MLAGVPATGAIMDPLYSATQAQYDYSSRQRSSSDGGFLSLGTGPPEVVIDKDLYQTGARARGMIAEMREQDEMLDPSRWRFHNLKICTKGNRI
jgi:hypothetical protein